MYPQAQPETPRPAWREPMVWLVFAIPAASVVAAFALLVAAARSSGTDDLVADKVQRTEQTQLADLGPDANARSLGLVAAVHVVGDTIEVLPVAGVFDREARLTLALHHPSRADNDRALVLQPTAAGWQGTLKLDRTHDWNVRLTPGDGRWRLQGRWAKARPAATLRPALDSAG
jgi:hypothetical protein